MVPTFAALPGLYVPSKLSHLTKTTFPLQWNYLVFDAPSSLGAITV